MGLKKTCTFIEHSKKKNMIWSKFITCLRSLKSQQWCMNSAHIQYPIHSFRREVILSSEIHAVQAVYSMWELQFWMKVNFQENKQDWRWKRLYCPWPVLYSEFSCVTAVSALENTEIKQQIQKQFCTFRDTNLLSFLMIQALASGSTDAYSWPSSKGEKPWTPMLMLSAVSLNCTSSLVTPSGMRTHTVMSSAVCCQK